MNIQLAGIYLDKKGTEYIVRNIGEKVEVYSPDTDSIKMYAKSTFKKFRYTGDTVVWNSDKSDFTYPKTPGADIDVYSLEAVEKLSKEGMTVGSQLMAELIDKLPGGFRKSIEMKDYHAKDFAVRVINGKRVGYIDIQKKGIRVFFRQQFLHMLPAEMVEDVKTYPKSYNWVLDASYKVTDPKELDVMISILVAAAKDIGVEV